MGGVLAIFSFSVGVTAYCLSRYLVWIFASVFEFGVLKNYLQEPRYDTRLFNPNKNFMIAMGGDLLLRIY